MRQIYSLILVFFTTLSWCQNTPIFKTGDRVCFIGNSITHAGEFHHNILLYHTLHFPTRVVSFYNCGISGDVTGGVLTRMESDILIHKPTHAVIMIGMNDVMRQLYGPKPTESADTLQKREKALAIYRTNLDSIVRILMSKKVKVILQKPSIYDQTAQIEKLNNLGVNDALKSCADFMEQLAKKYQLQTVDYWSIMSGINTSLQQENPKATIIGPDRVHPASPGNFVMFYQFLKSTSLSASNPVSLISVDCKLKLKESVNCSVNNLKIKENSINFVAKEKSLPFPVAQNQFPALDWIPFSTEYNSETVRIKNLSSGTYIFKIDTVTIGLFSNIQLQEGVNIALINKTPQYKQAAKVRETYARLWETESKLRSIKHIEYQHLKDFKYKSDFQATKHYLDSLFNARFAANAYLMLQKERFVANKPYEKLLEQQSDSLRKVAYVIAQPKNHIYKITPAK